MHKLIPPALGFFGLMLGIGVGFLMHPPDDDPVESEILTEHTDKGVFSPHEYVKLNNQFVVPVVEGGRVISMVVLSLSIETIAGSTESVYAHEPKVRDAFLQVLFDHANAGGFRGSFTDGLNLTLIRRALKEAAIRVLGDTVKDVLIIEIARQDS